MILSHFFLGKDLKIKAWDNLRKNQFYDVYHWERLLTVITK